MLDVEDDGKTEHIPAEYFSHEKEELIKARIYH